MLAIACRSRRLPVQRWSWAERVWRTMVSLMANGSTKKIRSSRRILPPTVMWSTPIRTSTSPWPKAPNRSWLKRPTRCTWCISTPPTKWCVMTTCWRCSTSRKSSGRVCVSPGSVVATTWSPGAWTSAWTSAGWRFTSTTPTLPPATPKAAWSLNSGWKPAIAATDITRRKICWASWWARGGTVRQGRSCTSCRTTIWKKITTPSLCSAPLNRRASRAKFSTVSTNCAGMLPVS